MAVGAVYTIIANQGKMDNLLTAPAFLKTRIDQIVCAKKRLAGGNPNVDVLPSLSDIEKTHILFVNAKYKPFVTTAMEYYAQSFGPNIAYNVSNLQVSIPQFGDFFTDMAFRAKISRVTTTTGYVPAVPTAIGEVTSETATGTISYRETGTAATSPLYKFTQKFVDFSGKTLNATTGTGSGITYGDPVQNYVRYCEYPGVRLFPITRFEVSSARLDSYSSLAQIIVAKKRIQPNKINAWKKLVGQEVSIESYSDPISYVGSNGYQGLMSAPIYNADATLDPASLTVATRSYKTASACYTGLQTPQLVIPEQVLWIPLWFWFNTDVHLAIPSAAIPFNNRYIKFDVAPKSDILSLAPGNLFYSVQIDQMLTSTGTAAGNVSAIVSSTERTIPYLAAGSEITGGDFTDLTLYINNLFIDPEIHELYIRRIGFSMIRIYLEQDTQVNTGRNSILMQQFKYPVEFFFVGGLPTNNVADPARSWRDWHRFQVINVEQVDSVANSADLRFGATTNADAIATTVVQKKISTTNVMNSAESIDALKVYVNGINLFNEEVSSFYKNYLQYTFGECTLNTQIDDGVLLVNFSLFPWTYQPSGHFNVSRTNQFYVDVVSSWANISGNILNVKFVAKAINFLLIADGSCVLRYTA